MAQLKVRLLRTRIRQLQHAGHSSIHAVVELPFERDHLAIFDLLVHLIHLVDVRGALEISMDSDSVTIRAGEVAVERCREGKRFHACVGDRRGAAQLTTVRRERDGVVDCKREPPALAHITDLIERQPHRDGRRRALDDAPRDAAPEAVLRP